MAPARRDLLRMLAVGGVVGTAAEVLPQQSAAAATAATATAATATSPPVPSGDTSGATDTKAIQAQLDQAATSGGTVTLTPGGMYTVTGLSIDSGVTLDLAGATLTLAAGANASVVSTKSFASLTGTDSTGGPTDFVVRNGYLDGNKANQTSTTKPVLAIYGRRYVLDQLVVRNGKGTGLFSQWSSNSPFLAPNGFESFVTRLYLHDCDGDGIRFQGPHDAYFHSFFVVRCAVTAGAVPLNLPDATGPANGSNFDKFHVYGGQGYNYGVVANTAGVKYTNFVVEGAQVAQVLIQASQVKMDALHLYAGNIADSTVKGIQLGDAAHPGVNGVWLRGVIENLGGGALDVTYCGDHNNIDLTHYVFGDIPSPAKADFGVVGTLTPLNTLHLDITGPTFTKTAASDHGWHGRTTIHRTGSTDTRPLLQLVDETNTTMTELDQYGRLVPRPGMGRPSVTAQAAGAGSGATVSISGTDMSGRVALTTGTSPTASTLLVVAFGHAWSDTVSSPRIMLQPSNIAAARLGAVSTENPSTAQWSIRPTIAPTAKTAYTWDYVVIG